MSVWQSPGPRCAASSTRVSGRPAIASLAFSHSVATNPLTRRLLFQMPGSTRSGFTLKVSVNGDRWAPPALRSRSIAAEGSTRPSSHATARSRSRAAPPPALTPQVRDRRRLDIVTLFTKKNLIYIYIQIISRSLKRQ